MRVYWIKQADHEAVTDAIAAALTPRDAFCVAAHWARFVELDSRVFDCTGIKERTIELDGFMVLLAMLARPRAWFEPTLPRAFGVPVEVVNNIGRMILGTGWPGIGALTLCDPTPHDGALTLTHEQGALEIAR